MGGAGLSEETQCEAGTYTIEPGQSTCLSAEPGEYVPEDGWSKEPKECEPGKTSRPEASSCDACPSGSYAKDSGSPICSPADKGYYVSKNDRTKQIPCDAGRYSPGSGATECAKCPLGTYAKSKNADRCAFDPWTVWTPEPICIFF